MSTQDPDEKVKVKVRAIIEYEIEADPKYASKEHIEFYRNEGTYCWDDLIEELEDLREKKNSGHSCLCSLPVRPRFEVLTDSAPASTPQPSRHDPDTIDWQMVGIMIEAHMTAARFHLAGTSNWGAHIYKAMKRESIRRAAAIADTETKKA